ncbi:hypothetical protein D3C85_677770 [compost metagenome]
MPDHRQHPVPGRARHQQQRFQPQAGDAAALLHADHAVDRQDQGRRAQGGVALAEGAEHGQGEAGQGQGGDEQPGIGEQPLHRIGRRAEAAEGHQQRGQAALPAVVGLGQGAGDHPEEQRNQRLHPVLRPAQQQGAAEGDEHSQAVAEFIQRPQAAQGMAKRGGGHPSDLSAAAIVSRLTEYADDGHSPGDTFYCVGGMSGLRKKSWTIL